MSTISALHNGSSWRQPSVQRPLRVSPLAGARFSGGSGLYESSASPSHLTPINQSSSLLRPPSANYTNSNVASSQVSYGGGTHVSASPSSSVNLRREFYKSGAHTLHSNAPHYSSGPQYSNAAMSDVSYNSGIQRNITGSVMSAHSSVAAGSVIAERVNEHRIRIPKKIVREDLYEKIIIIPERRMEEEIVEEEQIVREKIVEIAKPIIQERYVDIPEIEYRDKIIEVPEVRIEERITRIPRVEMVERIQHVPKIVHQEKIVEVPHVEYREVPVIKRVEVPQIQEEIVIKERPVTQYIDKPVPQYVEVERPYDVRVKVPVPVAAEMICDYEMPQLDQIVKQVPYHIYVPKFVEVPVPRPFVNEFWAGQATKLSNHVALLADRGEPMSLASVEKIAGDLNNQNFVGQIRQHIETEGVQNLATHYVQGGLHIQPAVDFSNSHMQMTHDYRGGRGVAAVEVPGTQYYEGKRRSRSSHARRSRRHKVEIQQQQPRGFWNRVCPEWLGNNNNNRKAADDYVIRTGSRRSRHQAATFSPDYPSFKVNDSGTTRRRRYSVGSVSSGTSYCSSCSECNDNLEMIRSPVNGRRY